MKIKVKLDEGATVPEKAYQSDAGFDLRVKTNADDITIPPRGSATIDTGVHVAIPAGWCGILKSKSGLNVKHDITGTGVIDSAYRGSIVVKLYNNGVDAYTLHPGDKCIQMIIVPVPDVTLAVSSILDDTDRGDKGFGSSGR